MLGLRPQCLLASASVRPIIIRDRDQRASGPARAGPGHGTPDPRPRPHPRICRGSGVGVPPPICRGSGVHPHHPHPRFQVAGDRGSLPWAVHPHHRPRFAGDRGSSPGGGSHRPGDSEVHARSNRYRCTLPVQWATVTGSRWASRSFKLANGDVQRLIQHRPVTFCRLGACTAAALVYTCEWEYDFRYSKLEL